MKLAQYLTEHGISGAELARKVGVPSITVYGWLKGQGPHPEFVALIVNATNGHVTAADLRPDLAKIFAEIPTT